MIISFSMSASEAFDIVYRGGKKDDVTVVVGCVAPKSEYTAGENYTEEEPRRV